MKKQLLVLSLLGSTLGSTVLLYSAEKKADKNKTNAVAENPPTDLDPTKKPAVPEKQDTGTIAVPAAGSEYVAGGCGFRKALGGLVKVYQICFFGKNMKAVDWSNSFGAPANTKAFKLKLDFLRGVGGKAVSAAFSEGLSKTPATQKLEDLERQKFLGWAAKLKIEKNSVMEFSFNDSKAVRVEFFEKANAGTQPDSYISDQKGLAKAIAAIWFGDKPINEDLKKDLLK